MEALTLAAARGPLQRRSGDGRTGTVIWSVEMRIKIRANVSL